MTQVDKQAIAAAFGRAASHYEQHAELQRQSADALLARWRGSSMPACWMPAAGQVA